MRVCVCLTSLNVRKIKYFSYLLTDNWDFSRYFVISRLIFLFIPRLLAEPQTIFCRDLACKYCPNVTLFHLFSNNLWLYLISTDSRTNFSGYPKGIN